MVKQVVKKVIGRRLLSLVKRIFRLDTLEEVDIVYEVLKASDTSPIMIDVGAHVGNTLESFAALGWSVYAFEPDPKNRRLLLERFGKHRDVSIDDRAVSNEKREGVSFFTSEMSTGISSLSSFHESHSETAAVDTITLSEFVKHQGISDVGFLKIDTEGHDLFVLQGIDWNVTSPTVIICEFEDRKTLPLEYGFHDIASFLLNRGYDVTVSEWWPLVEYGKRHRWRRFEAYPCELKSAEAWGNLIAVKDPEVNQKLQRILSTHAKRFALH